ncbi:MAG: 2-C-methyl-D-erythritol 4-phosphate cytidylyltransferase [Tepidisphaeraceae bacterium]
MPSLAVILPAAGASARFGTDADKLLAPLGDRPVIARSLGAFLVRRDVVQIIVPTRRPDLLAGQIPRDERVRTCPGGECRAQSVLRGLQALPDDIEWVAIHDAARPLVTQELIDRTFACAQEYGAAVPAMPVALTVKEARAPLPARVTRTVPRADLWSMQTPQIMRRADLLDAFARCPAPLDDITDDAQLLELAGREVWLVAGEERNIKITTPTDLRLAETLLQ